MRSEEGKDGKLDKRGYEVRKERMEIIPQTDECQAGKWVMRMLNHGMNGAGGGVQK